MADPLNLVTLRALLETEHRERELLTRQAAEAMAILAEFSQRISRENDLPATPMKDQNLPQAVQLAIHLFQLVLNTLRNRLTTPAQTVQEMEKQNRGIPERIPADRSESEPPPTTMIGPREVAGQRGPCPAPIPVMAPADGNWLATSREPAALVLSVTSQVIRVKALAEQCKHQLQISPVEFTVILKSLIGHGDIELVTTSRKPPYGVVFPTLLRVTPRGLEAVRLMTGRPAIAALNRLIERGKGLMLNEVPLLAYVVEEVLPRWGYAFIQYVPEIRIEHRGGIPHAFYPHAMMKSQNDSVMYVMYVGEPFRNEAGVEKYLDDYLMASGGHLFFITPTAKLARLVKEHMELLETSRRPFPSMNITNVYDLCAYEQAQKSGSGGLPATVWFGFLPEVSNG